MQAYKIALAVLCFNIVMTALATPGLSPFGAAFPDLEYTDGGSLVNYTWKYTPNGSYVLVYDTNLTNTSSSLQNVEVGGFDDFSLLAAVVLFVSVMLNSTILLPLFIESMGVPTIYAWMVTAPIWMVYGWGVIQMALRWGGESGE